MGKSVLERDYLDQQTFPCEERCNFHGALGKREEMTGREVDCPIAMVAGERRR